MNVGGDGVGADLGRLLAIVRIESGKTIAARKLRSLGCKRRRPVRQTTMKALARISPMMLLGLLLWPLSHGVQEVRAATDATLQVTPHAHDFGVVKRLGGEVHTTFTVRNQGEAPIKIRRIWTS
jgi:hypothetical protein